MRHVSRKKVLYIGLFIVFIIIFLHPNRNARRSYEYISRENVVANLNEQTSVNFTSSALVNCDYQDVVFDESTLSTSLVDGDLVEGHRIRDGGEYAPIECKPKFSTAIIVPFRDRVEQLRGFLVYMHIFLRRQLIHYRIFVVEQVDTRPFNKAKLINIGAKAAIKAGYPCLVLHNVDLLPLRPSNIYACTNSPRHMSCSINEYRFVLPHPNQFGGVIAIKSKQFESINGMSNEYCGVGGVDDDLYTRLEIHNLKVCRFEPEVSRYYMMLEGILKKSETKTLFGLTKNRIAVDGLNTLRYTEVATVLHPLFTHIIVEF